MLQRQCGIRRADDRIVIAEKLSQNPRAIALMVCLTKYDGTLNVLHDVCHSNPYICIGEIELPPDDNSQESAYWVGAVGILEKMGFIDKNTSNNVYKLTSDGWTNAGFYIDSNDFTEEELYNPNKLFASICDEYSYD